VEWPGVQVEHPWVFLLGEIN